MNGQGSTHVYFCRVRWSDVDAYGHVNNVKYFEYVQEARIRFMRGLGAGDLGGNNAWVVARQDVEYKRPMVFRSEPYEIKSRVTRIGRSSYDLCAEIVDDDAVLARARTVVVAFDAVQGCSRALAEGERAALEAVYAFD